MGFIVENSLQTSNIEVNHHGATHIPSAANTCSLVGIKCDLRNIRIHQLSFTLLAYFGLQESDARRKLCRNSFPDPII